MKTKKGAIATVFGFLFGIGGSPGMAAQDNQQAGSLKTRQPTVLEEIIVTATKRMQNLQDIPMSINAFSGDRLADSGIANVSDLQSLAAGMSVSEEAGNTKVHIRGIGNDNIHIGSESGVAMHRDGVYLVSQADVGLGFFDVERIEVLRGPQGTLYGRNATGGAVNIISAKPTVTFEAGASVTAGNYDLLETEGYLSGPIIGETLMGRIAFKKSEHDGYTPNTFDGEDYDNRDFVGGRVGLRFEPTETFLIDLTVDYARDDGVPVTLGSRGRSGPAPAERGGGTFASGRAINANDPQFNDKESAGLVARLDWEVGLVNFTSLTAYREFDQFYSVDIDSTDESFLYSSVPELREFEQRSQEFTLSSAGDSALEWLIGAYYWEEQHQQDPAQLAVKLILTDPSLDPVVPPIPIELLLNYQVEEYTGTAYALFGEASYPLFDRLMLTLGARYSKEEKEIVNTGPWVDDPVPIYDGRTSEDDAWSSFTPKIALTYSVTETISLYTTAGKGFKAGGYNGAAGNPEGSYDPEEVTSYELGVKGALFDGRLRANLAGFYMDYTDMQQTLFTPEPTTGIELPTVVNASEAKIRGVELDLQWRVTERLDLDATLSWLDAAFSDWPDAPDPLRPEPSPGPTPGPSGQFDVSGNRMLNAPEWAGTLGVNYTLVAAEWGSVILHGDYAYKGRTYYTPFEDEFLAQDSYGLFNARLAFESATGHWHLAGWARNLTDEELTSQRRETFGYVLDYPRPPRTYGMTLGLRF